MDTVALANYFAGRDVQPSPIEAWRADREASRALGVTVGTPVHLSYENFCKITLTHRDITFVEFARLREIITSSATFVSTGRLRSLEYTWVNRSGSLRVVLRATRKNELFVVSIYRVRFPEARRLYRRAREERRLIRDLETELARQLMPRQ